MIEADGTSVALPQELAELAERLDGDGHRFPWGVLDAGLLLEGLEACVANGLTVEFSAAGYGTMAQVKVLDESWRRVVFVCHQPREVDGLMAALKLDQGPAWVRGRMEALAKKKRRS